ncbi:hypothetical protein ATPR_1855 [Acetobacter tropicalis NBRC 101654]|uniref:Uncharacterized protein n=1 Tax=Acetobacter tropicalis NBRC 101654 TaxID=749388 RepID=F7VEQ6_9PROT|nr:hypothetical protein ATPR_1855 [Acetobacter tropicalis NBRC 101654]
MPNGLPLSQYFSLRWPRKRAFRSAAYFQKMFYQSATVGFPNSL